MPIPAIQWYPGHIAKAERQLQEQIKKVDVVLEVRDARIPFATYHPLLATWIGNKHKLLVLNRVDMIPLNVKELWTEWFLSQGEQPFFANAQQGTGVVAISKAAQSVGVAINQKRKERGMLPRPVRAVVIGFPNVGKSALINRLVNKKVVESARRAGVTRALRWVRISDQLELLDAPGIIPGRLSDQLAAVKLAICDDIGEAAYDRQGMAAALIELCQELGYVDGLNTRYGSVPTTLSGEEYLHQLANTKYRGDLERTSHLILNDFRTGVLGNIPLELPTKSVAPVS
ncbi:ribosome biogenesis GTPase YlqF [Chamaesiphon sp. VAR_48_metabat_135_sub]|uniref:ribosome biogenesis GTPase YlqF n=1 Tax=Chamaesiphon sp. VAR_48_metabat_135_sub TaxID=2964699 RepID=UPI002869FF0F|nr:ribosome biogenesis GTPase YlqF [Chamaesiphon sp. VAR_48_metabat_135_sub]